MKKIAVFASGRGSGFEAIAKAIGDGKLRAEITSLVCDVEGAAVLEKAKRVGIKTHLICPSLELPAGESRRTEHEQRILRAIEDESADFVVLAGYMRILGKPILEAFKHGDYSRVVNVHPSLLPAFPGIDAYRQAFHHGCKVSGVSVHLVSSELDSGPICAQESFSIEGCQSAEEVEKLGLALEHRLYPQTLAWVLAENFVLEAREGRFHVRKN